MQKEQFIKKKTAVLGTEPILLASQHDCGFLWSFLRVAEEKTISRS